MYMSESDTFPTSASRVLLLNLEIYYAFLELAGFGDCKADGGVFLIVVLDAMVFDGAFVRSTPVFGGGAGGEMPFY